MKTSTTTVVAISRRRIWLLNNGIAVSRYRARASLNQLTIFRCELLHVSSPLDADRGRLRAWSNGLQNRKKVAPLKQTWLFPEFDCSCDAGVATCCRFQGGRRPWINHIFEDKPTDAAALRATAPSLSCMTLRRLADEYQNDRGMMRFPRSVQTRRTDSIGRTNAAGPNVRTLCPAPPVRFFRSGLPECRPTQK